MNNDITVFDNNKFEAFAAILGKMESTNDGTIVPILKKIEANTSILRKFSGSTIPQRREKKPVIETETTTVVAKKVMAPEKSETVQKIKSEKLEEGEAQKPVDKVAAEPDEPVKAGQVRNKKGRFVSSRETQEATDESGNGPAKRRGKLSTLAAFASHMGKAYAKDKKGTVIEAAGRAALGPLYDAVVEAKEKFDEFKEKTSGLKEKYSQFKGPEAEKPVAEAKPFDGDVDAIVKSLQDSDMDDQKRHEELVKAILKKDKYSKPKQANKTTKNTQLPTHVNGVPFPSPLPPAPHSGGGDALLSRFALPALKRLALPILAVAGAGLAGVAAGKTISDGMDKGREFNDWTSDAASTFETGPKKTKAQAAATISSGAGDPGGKSYGIYQLASQRGEVDKFLKKSGYGERFNGLAVGSQEFDDKWKQVAAIDPKFADAQKQYAVETKYIPQIQKLSNAGIDLSGKGRAVQDMVLSTANQYGANTDVIAKALKGKDVSKMTGAEIASTVQDYKGATVGQYFPSSSPEVQASVVRRTQKEKAFLLAKDKAEHSVSAIATTKKTAPAPPTAIATSNTAAKVKQPERIQPSFEESKTTTAKSSSIGQGGALNIPGLDNLAATLAKMSRKGDQVTKQGRVHDIRTEYDDTMLILMAYDRL